MTNFQAQDAPRFGLTPERLLQLAPLVLALLLSALLGGAWLLPLKRHQGQPQVLRQVTMEILKKRNLRLRQLMMQQSNLEY